MISRSVCLFDSLFQELHYYTHLTALCLGLPRWAGIRKVKLIWILLKQETVSGSDISWAICKYAPRSRQITTPAPHHSDFYRPDALPAAQPTASKHWRQSGEISIINSLKKVVYICHIKNPMTHCTQLPQQRKAVAAKCRTWQQLVSQWWRQSIGQYVKTGLQQFDICW